MPDVYLSDPDAEGALVEVCRGVTLAIVDNLLAACASATLKENESGIRRFLDILTRVTSKTGCAFVVLVHERKAGKDDQGGGLQRVRGSSAITDAAGSVISIGAAEGDGIVSAQQTKSSLRKKGDELLFQIEDVGEAAGDDEDSPGVRVQLVSDRPPSEHRAKLQAQIIELLSKGPQESKRTIENSIKGKRGQIGPEVDALVVRREVVFIKGKGYVLDCPVARRGRLVEASRIPGLSTPEKLAKAACVDVSDVHAMLKDGVLFKSGSGFVATLEAAL